MADMDFLKNLGGSGDSSDEGSLINGMTAEEYAASLDEQQEETYIAPKPSAMGGDMGDLGDLPLTEISDMDAPSPSASGDAASQQAQGQPAGFGRANRYSSSSYGNTAYSASAEPYQTVRQRRASAAASNENIGLGIIGAILGAALGTVVWALIAWAGYISWVGAIAVVAGTYFGYLLFAKDIGRGGALVVCILIIAAVFCGNRLGFSIALHSELQKEVESGQIRLEEDEEILTVYEIFKDAGEYIDLLGMRSEYNGDMATSYIFTGIAAAVFFVKRLR